MMEMFSDLEMCPPPDLHLYIIISNLNLLLVFFRPHGVIVTRNTDSPLTGPSDTVVYILQSPEICSLHSGDLHFTNCKTIGTNWLDLCWIRVSKFKGVEYLSYYIFYIIIKITEFNL